MSTAATKNRGKLLTMRIRESQNVRVIDGAFEQFAGQSNVRGISDTLHPYAGLGVACDRSRNGVNHLGQRRPCKVCGCRLSCGGCKHLMQLNILLHRDSAI
jgi:hypothetical protein